MWMDGAVSVRVVCMWMDGAVRACVRVVCMWMDGAVNLYGYIGVDLRSRGSEIKETWSHTCRERQGERWGEMDGGREGRRVGAHI